LVTDGPKSNREEEKKMNKQMTAAEIQFLQQSFVRFVPISDKANLVGVESGPCPPPNIPAAIALASVTMK
jgi:hypothetical protein